MAVSQNKVVTSQALNTGQAVCTAAKTTYNDAANAVLLLTAGANGCVVYAIRAIPRATVTVTQLQLYRSSDGGVTLNLFDLALMAAYTMAQTTAPVPPNTDFLYTEAAPLRLKPAERIYCAAGVALAGGIVFDAMGEDL
jgi:hypothetical protein